MSFYPDSTSGAGYKNRRPKLVAAALGYAEQEGWPVLPLHSVGPDEVCTCGGPAVNPKCKPGKHPRWERGTLERGHLEATTDPDLIRAWWTKWPEANIGVPTGESTGLLVLDVDHPGGLDTLEDEHGELPATRTHSTGSGGMHLLYRYPDTGERFGNSSGSLPDGYDIRGEGGYIVAPRSRTQRPYTVLDRLPLASPPEWLLEALRRPQSAARGAGSTHHPGPIPLDSGGAAIPEGSRDNTLVSIAGRLHDGSRDLEALTSVLLEVNAARCEPPLPDAQVIKIARSIHPRTPCKTTRRATRETLEALDAVEHGELYRRDQAGGWSGMGGKSERSAYAALIVEAREHGELIPGGIRVSLSLRGWAIEAAVSRRAMLDYWKGGERKDGIVSRLKRRGLIRSDSFGRRDGDSGAFVLVTPVEGRARFHHSSTGRGSRGGGETLRSPRLRWSAPRFDRVGHEIIRSTIRRMGKGCEAIIDTLDAAGGELTIRELAAALGKGRMRDLRRRLIARLEAAAVVECSGETVALARDWLDAIDRERESAGEIAAEWRDRERYERERVAYAETRRRGELVSGKEFARLRRDRDRIRPEERHPSGTVGELEHAPASDPELVEVLRTYLDRNPHRTEELPGWLSVTLWADELVPSKPTPAAVELALAEIVGTEAA